MCAFDIEWIGGEEYRRAKRRSFTFTQRNSHWIAFASRKSFYEVRSSRLSSLFGRKSFTLLFIFCLCHRLYYNPNTLHRNCCGLAPNYCNGERKKVRAKGFENCPESAVLRLLRLGMPPRCDLLLIQNFWNSSRKLKWNTIRGLIFITRWSIFHFFEHKGN